MYTTPNLGDVAAGFANQAKPDKGDLEVIVDGGGNRNGVYTDYSGNSGLEVRPQDTPDMTVQVTPGSCVVDGRQIFHSTGTASLAIGAADATLDRTDLITIDNTGAFAVVAGSPDARARWPAIPANRTVLGQVVVRPSDTSITSDNIVDKRVPIQFRDHYDVRNFGASGSRLHNTGTTSGTTLTLGSAHTFVPGNGILVMGAGADNGLTGGSSALSIQGTPGATTYEYEYAFGVGYGDWTDPTAVSQSIATGPATLNATDFVRHQITPPSGCNTIAIYGRSAGTKDLLVTIPALVDDGQTYVQWDDQGDTVAYQQQTFRWRATERYKEGMLVVDTGTGTMHRVMRVIGDQMSNATVPAWDTTVNNMTSDDVGGQSSELTWVNVQPHVPLTSDQGEISQWLHTTVSSVTSRTVLTLSDAPTTEVTTSPVYHSDIERGLDALVALRDTAEGGKLVFGAPGYYHHPTGDIGNDPNMEDANVAAGERTVYNLYLNETGHDKNDNFDIQRDGTRRTIEVVVEAGATIIGMPGMDPAKNGGVSSPLDVPAGLFNPAATGLRFSGGGTITWWEFGCGWYERNADAAGDGSGWLMFNQVNDRYDMRVENLHLNYPQIYDGNGVTFDDGFQREFVTFADCVMHYGGGRDNRCLGLVHGGAVVRGGLAIADGFYAGDFMRCDGSITTEVHLSGGLKLIDWHRSGSGATAHIGEALDARGGSVHSAVGIHVEGFFDFKMAANRQLLSGCTFTDCDIALADARRIVVTGNNFHSTVSGTALNVTVLGASNNSDTINISNNVGKNWNISVTHSGTEIGGVNILGNQFLIDDASYDPARVIFCDGVDHPNIANNIIIVTAAVNPEGITLANTCPHAVVSGNNIRYKGASSTAIWFQGSSATVDGLKCVHNSVLYDSVTSSTVRLADLNTLTADHAVYGWNRVHIAAGGGNARFVRTSPGAGSTVTIEGNIHSTDGATPDGDEFEGAGVTNLINHTTPGIENDGAANSSGSRAHGNNINGKHSVVKDTSASATPNATADTYGTLVDVFGAPDGNETLSKIRTNNVQAFQHIEYTTSGVSAETVTVKFTATYNDTTTQTLEKTETTNTTTDLTNSELADLLKDDLAIRDFTIGIKSDGSSSGASVTGTASGITR